MILILKGPYFSLPSLLQQVLLLFCPHLIFWPVVQADVPGANGVGGSEKVWHSERKEECRLVPKKVQSCSWKLSISKELVVAFRKDLVDRLGQQSKELGLVPGC